MTLDVKFFVPESRYLDQLTGIARVGASGNRDFLYQGLDLLRERATAVPDQAQRNRMVMDGLSLLTGGWDAKSEPNLFDVDELDRQIQALQQSGVDRARLGKFLDLARECRDSTWTSFEDFQASEEGRRSFDPAKAGTAREFEAWYRRYRPYLVLGLPVDPEVALGKALTRIEWMIGKIAPSAEDDPLGVRELYLQDARYYVRDKYLQATQR